MRLFKKTLCFILCIIMLFSFSIVAFAKDSKDLQNDFVNPNSRVLSVAKYGNTSKYPANSIEGIKNSIKLGADVVTVSVKETKDKQLVLLSDEKLENVCAFKSDGTNAYGKVSEFTLEELKANFCLKAGMGGKDASATGCDIVTLSEVIDTAKGKIIIMVDNGYEYANDINAIAVEKSACNYIILRGFSDVDKIKGFVDESGKTTCYVAAYYSTDSSSGSAKDYLEKSLEAGAYIVELSASKENASIFKDATISKLDGKVRAFVSTSDSSLCGGRDDVSTSWAELCDIGFGMIETDYPKELVTYLNQIETYREDLAVLIGDAEGIETSKYTKASSKALETSLQNAISISSKGAVSFEKIEKARYDLKEALSNLTISTGDEKTVLPTWLVIIIVVASIIVLIVIVILGLRVFNKVKKGQRKLEKFKKKFNSEIPVENDETITTNIAEDEESNMGIEEDPIVADEQDEETTEIEEVVNEETQVEVEQDVPCEEPQDTTKETVSDNPHDIDTLLKKLEEEIKNNDIEISLRETTDEYVDISEDDSNNE